MKKLIRYLLFSNQEKHRILMGPAKGMQVKYDVNHRLQHLCGLYEREIYSYIRKSIPKSNVLIDIGANDGYYVLAFLKSGKQVIACEPGDIASELITNSGLNGYFESENFIVERRLVGDDTQPGFVSIEKLIEKAEKPLFFLVDIDGGEYDLLQSCGNNFDHSKATWLVETHSQELEDSCVDFLKSFKYKVTIIKNAWWRKLIPEQRPLQHNRWLFAEPC